MAPESGPVVLFDGVCNLCDRVVGFIIDRDPSANFRFAPLQSETAQRLLTQCDASALDALEPLASVVLIERGVAFVESTAALRIARRLSGPYWLLGCLQVVPRPLRDALYRWVARNRYRWFGRAQSCRVPTPALRSRFL